MTISSQSSGISAMIFSRTGEWFPELPRRVKLRVTAHPVRLVGANSARVRGAEQLANDGDRATRPREKGLDEGSVSAMVNGSVLASRFARKEVER